MLGRFSLALVICAIGWNASGCGGDSAAGFDRGAVDRRLDELNQQAQAICACSEARAGQSESECLRQHGVVRPSERECVIGVDARYGAAVSELAACVLPAEEKLSACLQAQSCGSDDGCTDAYMKSRSDCLRNHPLPKALKTEESLCFEGGDVSKEQDHDAGMGRKSDAGNAAHDAGSKADPPATRSDAGTKHDAPSNMMNVDPAVAMAAANGGCANDLGVNPKVSIPTTWSNGPSDCDYLVRGLASLSSSLTIEPGTVVQFSQDGGFTIESGGQLTAVGEASARIRFIGVNDVNGYWNGVQFLSGSRESRIEYVDIRNAGQTGSESWKYGRAIGGTGVITFKHNNVSRSYNAGANFSDALVLKEFEANVFEDNQTYGLVLGYNQLHMLDKASDYLGKAKPNGIPYIFAKWDKDLQVESTWKDVGAPYMFQIVMNVHAPLTLEPGVQLVAKDGASIEVSGRGSLTAIGTEAKPIVFTAENKARGAWTGLIFYDAGSPSNQLQHVKIEYACDGGRVGGHRAAIELISSGTSCSVDMKDSVISDCSGYPVCLQTDVKKQNFTFSNVDSLRNDYKDVTVCN